MFWIYCIIIEELDEEVNITFWSAHNSMTDICGVHLYITGNKRLQFCEEKKHVSVSTNIAKLYWNSKKKYCMAWHRLEVRYFSKSTFFKTALEELFQTRKLW